MEIVMKFIRRKTVEELTGLSRSSIYAMMSEGTFPKQIRIGRRAVVWRQEDIENWINEKILKAYKYD